MKWYLQILASFNVVNGTVLAAVRSVAGDPWAFGWMALAMFSLMWIVNSTGANPK